MHPVDSQGLEPGLQGCRAFVEVQDETPPEQAIAMQHSDLLRRMAAKRHPTQVGAQTEQLQRAIEQLLQAQQAVLAAAEALAQTAAVIKAAATRPKRIEVLRGPDGRLEGATVSERD